MSNKKPDDRYMMPSKGVQVTKGKGKVLVNLKDFFAGGSGKPGEEGSITKENHKQPKEKKS